MEYWASRFFCLSSSYFAGKKVEITVSEYFVACRFAKKIDIDYICKILGF